MTAGGPKVFEQRMMGPGGSTQLIKYWNVCKGREWYDQHPARASIDSAPHKHITIRVFGDDAPLNSSASLMLILWSSEMCSLPSWQSKMLFATLYLAYTLPEVSLACVYEALVWVVEVLHSGEFPMCDHKPRPWEVGSRRSQMAGKRMRNGYKFICVGFLSD